MATIERKRMSSINAESRTGIKPDKSACHLKFSRNTINGVVSHPGSEAKNLTTEQEDMIELHNFIVQEEQEQ